MDVEIRGPIFIVGCPRSGTNVLYRRLARHPDLGWISNVTKRFPESVLLTRLLMLVRRKHHPTEAKNVWGKYGRAEDDALGAADATPEAARYLRRVVSNTLRVSGKVRFLNKCPRNSVRIEFLDAVFPDAFFIHVIRDGRAVANSLRRARENHGGAYWGCRPPGWRELLGRPMVESCALQWRLIVEHALRSASSLPKGRYMDVRYEEFCEGPRAVLEGIGAWCGLRWEGALLDELAQGLESRNFKWRESFSGAEVETLNAIQCELLARLGYPIDPGKA